MCKIVKTQRLAGYLMYKGYILLRTDKDRKNPKFDIYIFKYKDGIEEEINNYVNLHNGGKQSNVVSRETREAVETFR